MQQCKSRPQGGFFVGCDWQKQEVGVHRAKKQNPQR